MSNLDTINARLLLVEDNPRAMDMLKRWLVRFGYQFLTEARSAAEANQIIGKEHFDIIVADMRMEAADSAFAVIDEVRQRNISSVVIVFTANETWLDCRKAFRQRVCWDYISKNMDGVNPYEELHNSIQEAIIYFNRWGNRNDEVWIIENNTELLQKFRGQYIAVINHTVIENADTEEGLRKKINERKLPLFLPVIRKMDVKLLHGIPISEIRGMKENDVLECKSTLCFDIDNNKGNDELAKQCLKTIAGFLNSAGGTLVIGLRDDGGIFGLRNDYSLLKEGRRNRDGFENRLRDMISSNISKVFASSEHIMMRFEELEGNDICIIDVRPVSEPVFLTKNKEFYIRTGNSTRALDLEEFYRYLRIRFK